MSTDELLTDELFARFSRLLNKKTGIALKEYKKYLVISRLSQFVGPGKKYETFDEFYQILSNDPQNEVVQSFINALTTNFSYFFRDPVHFEAMKQYLSEWGPRQEYLRFWSAASSSGEEAYSMAITLANHMERLPSDRKILATDISTKVLNIAEKGCYSEEHVKKYVSPSDLRKYFDIVDGEKPYSVKSSLRSLVTFRYLNLLGEFPFQKKFDIIFLRNVLIYFGAQEKQYVVQRMFDFLKPGGVLMIGLSESLTGNHHSFQSFKNSIYIKPMD